MTHSSVLNLKVTAKKIVKTGNAALLKDFTQYLIGPELPLIDLDNCKIPDGNFTCETSLDNVVDVYYFDDADTFSCKDQVSEIISNYKRTSPLTNFVMNVLEECFD